MSATLSATSEWKTAYPGAAAGLLVMEKVANPPAHPELERQKAEIERRLRDRYGSWTRAQLVAEPTLKAYADYYGRFKKTYHVHANVRIVTPAAVIVSLEVASA